MNDAPRRWWSRLGKTLRSYKLIPTRADRCVYVLYSPASGETQLRGSSGETQPRQSSGEAGSAGGTSQSSESHNSITRPMDNMDSILEHLLDPITGSPTNQMKVLGLVVLHVDDLQAHLSSNDR